MAELGLVCKNCGNRIAKALAQLPVIGFMGKLNEFVYGFGV